MESICASQRHLIRVNVSNEVILWFKVVAHNYLLPAVFFSSSVKKTTDEEHVFSSQLLKDAFDTTGQALSKLLNNRPS